MRALHIAAAVFTAALLTGTAQAQKATEIYIPIGKSPGLSGKSTAIGFIQSVNEETMTITIAGGNRTWKAQIDHETRIYLDRSAYRQRCLYGTDKDCITGLLCEVKFEGGANPQSITCEWIKIQPIDTRPPPRRRARSGR